jgi:putative CocE/NonD family hydrolase
MRDTRIPVRDGNYILGNVYLPLEHRKRYPVLIGCTVYGKRVVYGGPDLQDAKGIAAFERAEDEWHSTTADFEIDVLNKGPWFRHWTHQRGFGNIATFNTFTYVPKGYAMVKIDPKGVSETLGSRGVPGQIGSDLFDTVEWAGKQNWSDGNIALVGSSYGENVQWSVADLKPRGLRYFVPYASKKNPCNENKKISNLAAAADFDVYREAIYTGGIPAYRYMSHWHERVKRASPKWKDLVDVERLLTANPFDNELWESVSTKPAKDGLPCFLAASQIFIIHGRGAYEAWRLRNLKIRIFSSWIVTTFPGPTTKQRVRYYNSLTVI